MFFFGFSTEFTRTAFKQAQLTTPYWTERHRRALFTDLESAPSCITPRVIPFVFDSGASCVMVNSAQHGKGWCVANNSVSITTTNGGKLPVPKVGGIVSLLSFSLTMKHWEQMVYNNCLLVPDLVTNLIGTKTHSSKRKSDV